jgi:DNA-binding CsgD family transcriptional regulator
VPTDQLLPPATGEGWDGGDGDFICVTSNAHNTPSHEYQDKSHTECALQETLVELAMRKHILLYGILGGVLIAGLKFIEYRWLVVEHSIEIYGALVATVFAAFGIWLGLRLTRHTKIVEVREVMVAAPAEFVRDQEKLESLGITPRELEVLQLIAEGLSNKEIAARVFVSENTIKTHSSRVFDKLGARRRTQAVQIAKEFRLIP